MPNRASYCTLFSYINMVVLLILTRAHLLDKHKVTLSSNAKMYKCPLCDAFFGRRSELKEHRTEAHPGQSEHICTVCGKMLMSASLLEKHMRNHTGKKINPMHT